MLKYFDETRRFGFARLPDGRDAHVSSHVLAPHGGTLPRGTILLARVIERRQGPAVAEILAVDTWTAIPERPQQPLGPVVRRLAVLKAITTGGFAFAGLDDGGGDVFISRRTTERAELYSVPIGSPLELRVAKTPEGLVAVSVKVPPTID